MTSPKQVQVIIVFNDIIVQYVNRTKPIQQSGFTLPLKSHGDSNSFTFLLHLSSFFLILYKRKIESVSTIVCTSAQYTG